MILAEATDRTAIYRFLTVTVAAIGILFGCVVVIRPFLPALLLASIFCLSAWPWFEWLEVKLKGRTSLAATLMTLFLAVCFLVPLIVLGSSLVGNLPSTSDLITDAQKFQPPQQILDMPVIGPIVDQFWKDYGADRQQFLKTNMKEYAAPISHWLLDFGASVSHGIVDTLLGILIAFFFFRHGVPAVQLLHNLMGKFVGPRGRHLLDVSKKTIIGIVYGVFGTAVAQGTFAGIGFWIANVPAAAFFGLITVIVSVIPAGYSFVWLPVTAWLFLAGHAVMGIFIFLWGGTILCVADLFIRPYFIARGSDLPILLVIFGIFGGIIAFGFIGLFIGPTLLAVAYALLLELSRPDKGELTATSAAHT